LKFWADELQDAMDQIGRPLRLDPVRTQRLLTKVGFVEIKQEVFRLPVNASCETPYEVDVGRWFNLCLQKSFMSLSLAPLSRVKKWKLEDIQELEKKVLDEIGERSNQAYFKLYVWTARKP
ncbi:hypothetical protein F5883DRAFT_364230, partial [Diaporthe sp. PMI_573]